MNEFSLKNGQLYAESVPLAEIAERFGTPCYIYSRAALESSLDEFLGELAGIYSQVCYAMKANSNLAVLNVFARRGGGSVNGPRVPQAPRAMVSSRAASGRCRRMGGLTKMENGSTG